VTTQAPGKSRQLVEAFKQDQLDSQNRRLRAVHNRDALLRDYEWARQRWQKPTVAADEAARAELVALNELEQREKDDELRAQFDQLSDVVQWMRVVRSKLDDP
jgi:hypothetical protein